MDDRERRRTTDDRRRQLSPTQLSSVVRRQSSRHYQSLTTRDSSVTDNSVTPESLTEMALACPTTITLSPMAKGPRSSGSCDRRSKYALEYGFTDTVFMVG